MALDAEVEQAIRRSCEAATQSEAVARRTVKWLNELAEGNCRLEDRDDVAQRIDGILEQINVAQQFVQPDEE